MIDIAKFTTLQKKVEKMKTDAAKASGALEQKMAELKSKFSCETTSEAEALLKKLQEAETKACNEFEQALADFEEEWGAQLESAT